MTANSVVISFSCSVELSVESLMAWITFSVSCRVRVNTGLNLSKTSLATFDSSCASYALLVPVKDFSAARKRLLTSLRGDKISRIHDQELRAGAIPDNFNYFPPDDKLSCTFHQKH